jgi:outer membrane immunogenic protein
MTIFGLSRRFALALTFLSVASAHAAGPTPVLSDPVVTPPASAAARFSGHYIGASLAYACCGADKVGVRYLGTLTQGPELHIEGMIASARVGPRQSVGEHIFGIELEAEFGDVDDTKRRNGITATSVISNIVAMKGMVSVVTGDDYMLYAVAGAASGRSRYTVRDSSFSVSRAQRFPGYLVGVGLEVARTDEWSLRGEYLVYEFGRNRVSGAGRSSEATPTFHALRLGINYDF